MNFECYHQNDDKKKVKQENGYNIFSFDFCLYYSSPYSEMSEVKAGYLLLKTDPFRRLDTRSVSPNFKNFLKPTIWQKLFQQLTWCSQVWKWAELPAPSKLFSLHFLHFLLHHCLCSRLNCASNLRGSSGVLSQNWSEELDQNWKLKSWSEQRTRQILVDKVWLPLQIYVSCQR